MYDFIIEVAHTLWKNGLTLSALGTALYVLLRQRRVKRLLRKSIPWLLSDDSDVMNYEARQIRIESKIDAIARHTGVTEWDALSNDGKDAQSRIGGQKNWSPSQPAAIFPVPSVTSYTTQTEKIYQYAKWWRVSKMNNTAKTFLSGKKKIGAISVAVIVNGLNDVLGLGLSPSTIEVTTYLSGGYVLVEALLDLVRTLSQHFLKKTEITNGGQNDDNLEVPIEPLV